MSQNFTLIDGANTKTVRVTRTVGLLSTSIRATLRPARYSERAFVEGDGVELATPFTLYCLIAEESLGVVNDEIESIISFAASADYVRRDSVTHYRAVNGLQNHPSPTRVNTVSWELGLTFAPTFARWTTTQVNTLSGYEGATKI